MNYYQYHIGDYRTATSHLTLEEDATYHRLIDLQYDKEGALTNDIPVLARRVRSSEAMVKNILTEFFVLCEAGWENKRVAEEIQKHHAYIAKQRDAGKKSAYKRTIVEPSLNQCSTSVQPVLNQASTSVEPALSEPSTSVEGSSTSVQPEPAFNLPLPNTQYPIPNTQKKKRIAYAEIDFEGLPEVLCSEAFKLAWIAFIAYRKESKRPLYPASFQAKWTQMASWGEPQAINAINTAIANGWQGIFPPDNVTNQPTKSEENSKYKNAF